jgi:Zn-dependent protease with chaperone function
MSFDSKDISSQKKAIRLWNLQFALVFTLSLIVIFLVFFLILKGFFFLSLSQSAFELAPNWPAALVSLALVIAIFALSLTRSRAMTSRGGFYLPSRLLAAPLGDDWFYLFPEAEKREKLLRGIVSKLSVRAALPEPDIYVLTNDDSINALPAGLERDDSSIVITMGTIKFLTPEELTALLAREIHQLANDEARRLNLISGWLHGLTFPRTLSLTFAPKLPLPLALSISLLLNILGFPGNLLALIMESH